MGNAAFTRVAVTLMPDDELNKIQANNSEVCGAAVCAKISALKPVHEYERKITLHSSGTGFLCIKLGKTQQIQLKTLYMICKKKIAADAIALSAAAEDEMPLPSLTRIPVLAIYVQVKRGALKSAFLAVNRPFPDKNRHQWIWNPTDDKFRKLQNDHRKTLGHQRAEPPFPVLEVAAAAGDPNAAAVASMASARNPLKAQPIIDRELGTSGCVFDLTNQSTEFFKVGEYFLSLTAEDDAQISFPPEVPAGSYHGGTEVIVTAKITMRTLLPTAKSLLKVAQILTPEQKAEREAKAAKFRELEAKRVKQEEEEAKARAERARVMREEAEKQKAEAEAKRAAAEEERLAKIKAEKLAEVEAAAAAAAAGPDPFGDDDAAKRPTTAQNESKYDDPFDDKPAAVVAAVSKDDPFASVGSTPVPSARPGAKDLDVLDALDAAEAEEKANAIAAAAAARRAAEEEAAEVEESSDDEAHPDVLANVSGMTTPKLSPDLLAQMDSARTTPQVAKSDINSLSLASTPLVKPIKADPRALDALPDKPLKPVSLEQRPAVVLSAQELQVPLESLPATKSTPIRDVLAQEQTPRLEPRPADAPTLSRMPSPAVKPVQASAKVLDSIPLNQLGEKPVEKNTRVLDELPTPKLKPVAKDSRVLDALAGPEVLPPMELPVQEAPQSAHTVSNADVDAILGPPGSEKQKKKKTVQKPIASALPPRVPIRQPSVAVRPTNPVSPQPQEPIPVLGATLSPDTTPRNSISAAKVSGSGESDKNPLDDLPDDPPSRSKQKQSPAVVAKSDRSPSLNPLDRDSPFASAPPTPQPQQAQPAVPASSMDPFDGLGDDSPAKPAAASSDKKDALDDIFGDEDQPPPVPSYDPNLLDSL